LGVESFRRKKGVRVVMRATLVYYNREDFGRLFPCGYAVVLAEGGEEYPVPLDCDLVASSVDDGRDEEEDETRRIPCLIKLDSEDSCIFLTLRRDPDIEYQDELVYDEHWSARVAWEKERVISEDDDTHEQEDDEEEEGPNDEWEDDQDEDD